MDLCGLILLSTLISTITTRITQLRSLGSVMLAERKAMSTYTRKNSTSMHLGIRVMNFVQACLQIS